MKLTKRVLAMILAVAMVVGMVAVGAYASVSDYYDWDPDTNPYTAKIITKLYLVDTKTGEETAIDANADGKYEVVPGEVIRVETSLQTNYLAGGATLTPAYTNDIFLPTKNAANDYATYTMLQSSTSAVARGAVFEYPTSVADGERDGTLDSAPFLYGDAWVVSAGIVGGPYNALKALYPIDWRGTGTTATNYLSATGFEQKLNVIRIAFGAAGEGYPARGSAIIVVEPEVLFSYYLTVDANTVGKTGVVGQPAENMQFTGNTQGNNLGTKNVANIPCYYVKGDNEYDTTSNALAVASATSKKNDVVYVGTDKTGDIVYDIQNCDIVVVEKHGGEEPPVPQVDKTALETAINTLPAITQDQATSASWTAYTEALAAAQEVFGDAEATQDEVDTAAANLTEAINAVVALGTCDYTALDAAIAAYNALDLNAYTPASITDSDVVAKAAAANAIEADLIDDEAGENQAAINAAATALNAAIDALVAKADKTALETAINTQPAIAEANATVASWAAYTQALAAAQEVYDDANASQADVDAAAAALDAAREAIVGLGTCDYTDLNDYIAAYEALDLNAYTPASVEASGVVAAYNAAKAIEADLIADEAGENQAAINAAASALSDAIDALVLKADKTALNTAIATLPAVDEANATAASWAAYAEALAAAQALAADDNAAQADVDNAAAALTEATNAVVALGACDYTALDAAIDAYDALDLTAYTPASVEASGIAAAKAAADAVARDLINDEAGENQAAINAAATALNNAIAALVAKADKTALTTAIADALAKEEDAYTPASWTDAALADVIAAAQVVAADDNATADEVTAQIDALEAAVAKLVAKADKAALNAAIETLPTVDEANATAASWAAYQDALTTAQTLAADDNATQDDVDNATTALIDAINGVVALGACDYTALDAAIAAYTALDINAYTPASVTASDVAAKAEAANAVARDLINDETGANQAIINDAAAALNNAIAALVAKADKTELAAAIATTPAVDEANATAASWAAYTDALAAANTVNNDDNATQDEVDTAKNNLLAAIDGVAALGACDYTALDAAIAAYTALDLNAYTPNSITASDVVAKAEAANAVARDLIADEQGENQAAINAAADALTAAINALVAKADKTALAAAIATTPAVDEANATAASWAAYTDALAAANTVNADDNATQADVDAAAEALTAAIEGVVALGACDYTALDAAIAAYDALDLDAYTPASVEASGIAAAKAAADAVARDLIADEQGENQAAINEAATALNNAIAALVAKADKTALNAEIAAAPAMDEDTATADSWDAYQAALAAAQAVAADDNATTADVENATAALAAAKNALTARGLCDYTALDAALALTPAEAAEAYTASTWAAYANAKAAAEAIARDLVNNKAGTNQASIDEAAAALVAAFDALKLSTSNVTSADYDADTYFAKGAMTYTFRVNGAATKIQVINNATGATQTYDRYHEKVDIVSYNEAGEEVDYATTEPAYELWTVDLTLAAGGYTVIAKYGKVWDTEGLELNIEYATYEPSYTAEAKVGEGEYGKAVEIEAKHGSAVTFRVVTPTDVQKIQLALENGKTSTYTAENAVEDGDTLVWTVTRVFRAADAGECTVKTKSISGWTAMDDAVITVAVAGAAE